jgi:hypothetical protein
VPDLSPAAELTAAAKELRASATAAEHVSPGPWSLDQSTYDAGIIYAADEATIVVDRSLDDAEDDHGDMPYLALMHPGVGLAVADLLEATLLPAHPDPCPCSPNRCPTQAALTLARALLGGAS